MTTDLHAYEAVCVQEGGCFLLLLTHLLEATHFFKHCDRTYIYIYIYIILYIILCLHNIGVPYYIYIYSYMYKYIIFIHIYGVPYICIN